MRIKIIALPHFDRRLKRLMRKFKDLSGELAKLEKVIEQNPRQGKNLGAGLYKIRLASKSEGKGKSGGFRVITYFVEQVGDNEVVYLATIYDKSEEDSITKIDLLAIVQEAFDERATNPDE